jgi:hypothetical protein
MKSNQTIKFFRFLAPKIKSMKIARDEVRCGARSTRKKTKTLPRYFPGLNRLGRPRLRVYFCLFIERKQKFAPPALCRNASDVKF